jgi:hypothetical protein
LGGPRRQPAHPQAIEGHPVVDHLRIRRNTPGGLWVVADARYAISGPLGAIGGRNDLSDCASRRMLHATPDERALLQTVVRALPSDAPE